MKKVPICFLLAVLVFWCGSLQARPANIILFIGDGMGPEQVKAARLYNGDPLFFESFPFQGEIRTPSANSSVTDSAAAATAMATGIKVNNEVISLALPGDGSELFTLLEEATLNGKMTGLVTTATITHATPAAFGAHETSRFNTNEIAGDYLERSLPNILFGGGANGLTVESAQAAGYEVVTDLAGFSAIDTFQSHVSAQFGDDHMPYKYDYLGRGYPFPDLAAMTATALDILDNDPDGFFLMVEGGRIDIACHMNDIERAVHEALDFSKAIQEAMEWAEGRSDTLILVVADHETGGLSVETDNGPLQYPAVSWTTFNHTGVNVPVYAWGVNARYFNAEIENTDIFNFCRIDDDGTPIITTAQVSSVTSTQALSGGTVIDEGSSAITVRGVCWSTNAAPTPEDSSTVDGSGL